MGWDAEDRLDVAGVALAVIVVLSLGLAIFGAVQAATQDGPEPPDTAWSVERVNESHVAIENVGNETILAENLVITVNGDLHKKSFEGVVRPGERVTTRVEGDKVVGVVWTGGSGGHVTMHREQV